MVGKYKDVFGSPIKKQEWVKKIMQNNHYYQSQVVYVGDALSDYEAATENGIHFVGRLSDRNINPFESVNVKYIISDLKNLKDIIHGINEEIIDIRT